MSSLLPPEEFVWDTSEVHQYDSSVPGRSSPLHDPGVGSSRGPFGQPSKSTYHPPYDDRSQSNPFTGVTREFGSSQQPLTATNPLQEVRSVRKRRSRRQQVDWDYYKDDIKKLYLDADKSLAETMKLLKEDYSFDAPVKAYKEKFKEWKWQKNLPAEHAQWMVSKAHKRKREEAKETVFIYGGSKWTKERAESSASRSKKRMLDAELMQIDYHPEIDFVTPKDRQITETPKSPTLLDEMDVEVISINGETSDEEDDADQGLYLTWQGYARADLNSMLQVAKQHKLNHEFSAAEGLLRKVFQGYTKIISATGEDTNKVAYLLATLYAEHDQMEDADKVIEEVSRRHIKRWGIEDRRTQQHILHVVELLNGWNRATDALAFLARAWDLASESERVPPARKQNRSRSGLALHTVPPQRKQLSDVISSTIDNPTSAQVDVALGLIRAHVQANDNSVETYLLGIMRLCDDNIEDLAIQSLKARSALLKLYIKTQMAFDRVEGFENIQGAIERVWDRYEWHDDEFQSLEILEASMELTAALLKGGYSEEACRIFRRVDEKAEALFGRADERTIWIYISIGLVYQQDGVGWHTARPWFEQALSAAMEEYKPSDGIVKSLERALEKGHFTYLSDEGRPFKTIFGVSGIVIRPGRLHLE